MNCHPHLSVTLFATEAAQPAPQIEELSVTSTLHVSCPDSSHSAGERSSSHHSPGPESLLLNFSVWLKTGTSHFKCSTNLTLTLQS